MTSSAACSMFLFTVDTANCPIPANQQCVLRCNAGDHCSSHRYTDADSSLSNRCSPCVGSAQLMWDPPDSCGSARLMWDPSDSCGIRPTQRSVEGGSASDCHRRTCHHSCASHQQLRLASAGSPDPPTPHSSLRTPHSSLLTPQSLLTPTTHRSPLTSYY